MNLEILEQASHQIRMRWPLAKPTCGLILGSGWSAIADCFEIKDTISYEDIPGFGKPGVAGHEGRLAWGELCGIDTLIFQGRRHWYEGEGWTPIAVPVFVLQQMGTNHLILTNAAGSLRPGLNPGDIMMIDDHVNNMGSNPLIGPHHPVWGPRFPDQSNIYDKYLRSLIGRAGENLGERFQHGVYMACSGPTYETPAEIRCYRALGADAVGMSTVPEAILANAGGMRVAGISCITNLAAGMSKQPLSHDEVTIAAEHAMPRMAELIKGFWSALSTANIS